MKILITGCSSYIGQYLIERFLDNKNYQIIGISRSKPNISNNRFKWFKHDLSSKPFKKKKIDAIIHVAGAALRKENNFENYLKGNIFMAYNVGKTSEILKPKIIFYTSTREIYGEISSSKLLKKIQL